MTLSVPPARRILAVAALTVLLAACAHSGPRNPLATWVPSKNFDERRPVVIVLHYTEQDSVEQSLDTLRSRNSGGRVSSHYLLGKDGKIYQLVSDAKRAWHAGAGRWGGWRSRPTCGSGASRWWPRWNTFARATWKTPSGWRNDCWTIPKIYCTKRPAGCCAKRANATRKHWKIFWAGMRKDCRERRCAMPSRDLRRPSGGNGWAKNPGEFYLQTLDNNSTMTK